MANSQCSPSGPAFSEPHTTCSRALQQSRASPQQSICSKPHMPSKLVAATNVPDKDINKPPTRVILWPSVIDSLIAAAWNADTQQGTHGSRGAQLNGGHPKRKSETQQPLPHGAWVATKWSAGVATGPRSYLPGMKQARGRTACRTLTPSATAPAAAARWPRSAAPHRG
jgi:hypothetical protein